jgi:hypothetical protein
VVTRNDDVEQALLIVEMKLRDAAAPHAPTRLRGRCRNASRFSRITPRASLPTV